MPPVISFDDMSHKLNVLKCCSYPVTDMNQRLWAQPANATGSPSLGGGARRNLATACCGAVGDQQRSTPISPVMKVPL